MFKYFYLYLNLFFLQENDWIYFDNNNVNDNVDDENNFDCCTEELPTINRIDNRFKSYQRYARRISILIQLIISFIYAISIIYIYSYNLQLTFNYCPLYQRVELYYSLYLILPLIALIITIIYYKHYWPFWILWCLNIITWLLIYMRIKTVERIERYYLTEAEINYYDKFTDKLYAIGECVIGLKIWLGIIYLFNLILLFDIIICHLLLPFVGTIVHLCCVRK